MAKEPTWNLFLKVAVLGGITYVGYQAIEAGAFRGIGDALRCTFNPSMCTGGKPNPSPTPTPTPKPGPTPIPPPPGCNRSFIAGKRYVDFNAEHQQYAVVMCGQVISWHDRQTEAEAYYNAIVCNPEYQNC